MGDAIRYEVAVERVILADGRSGWLIIRGGAGEPIEICLDGVEAWRPDIEPEPEQRCDDCGTALRDLHRDALTGDWLCGPCFFKRPDAHADGTLVDEPEDAEQDHGLGRSRAIRWTACPRRAGAGRALHRAGLAGCRGGARRPGRRHRRGRQPAGAPGMAGARNSVGGNLAPRGAGKSPAQDIAFRPLRDRDAALGDDDPPLLLGDLTLEALARDLARTGGAGAVDVDELAQLLRGLGEYKGRGGGDRGRLLSLWSGAHWSYRRVGTGKKADNAVALRIRAPPWSSAAACSPRCTRCSAATRTASSPLAAAPRTHGPGARLGGGGPRGWAWSDLLGTLMGQRGHERQWAPSEEARRVFTHWRRRWKTEARGAEAPSISSALDKADVHLARVALVMAEADQQGRGGTLGAEVMARAAAIVRSPWTAGARCPTRAMGSGCPTATGR